jgi:hypothetical protein
VDHFHGTIDAFISALPCANAEGHRKNYPIKKNIVARKRKEKEKKKKKKKEKRKISPLNLRQRARKSRIIAFSPEWRNRVALLWPANPAN